MLLTLCFSWLAVCFVFELTYCFQFLFFFFSLLPRSCLLAPTLGIDGSETRRACLLSVIYCCLLSFSIDEPTILALDIFWNGLGSRLSMERVAAAALSLPSMLPQYLYSRFQRCCEHCWLNFLYVFNHSLPWEGGCFEFFLPPASLYSSPLVLYMHICTRYVYTDGSILWAGS